MQAMNWRRVEVVDEIMMGRKIVEWTLDPKTRPKTLDEFKEQVRGALNIVSPNITKFELIDTPDDTVTIRLPAAAPLEAAKKEYSSSGATVDNYRFPSYLQVDKEKIKQSKITPEQLFYGSIGDYTTKECE